MANRAKRNNRIIELRKLNYSYQAIAIQLHREGLTETQVSRVRIQELLREIDPGLMGWIKRKTGAKRMVRRHEIE